MRVNSPRLFKLVLLVAFLLSFTLVRAQIRYAPLSTEKFAISVKNLTKTASNKLEFDVFLLDTDAGQPFELGNCQIGFLLNSTIFAGGAIAVEINNAASGLNDNQKFTAIPSITGSLPGNPGQTLIRLAGRTSPGSGNGTIISSTGQGTLLTHFVITNSVNFKINSTPKLTFTPNTANIPLYATRVSEYINFANTPLTIIPGTNALVTGNIVLTDDFILSVKNLKQTAPAKLEFDVSLFDANSNLPFELGSLQLGFLFNSFIYTGGTISVAISNSGSGLNTAQQFTAVPAIISSIPGTPDRTLIRLAGRTTPGDGNGTTVSMTNPETLLTHFTISSSVNFTANSTPDLAFISSRSVIPLYASRISEYIDHANTPLVVMPDTNAIVYGNPVLNTTFTAPVAYDITAGGSYCQVVGGFPVGLVNSEYGVLYTLYKDGILQALTVSGTGAAISFGKQLFGTYTISGTNGSGTILMTGSAVVNENTIMATSVTITPDIYNICPGTLVTFTATGINKGTNPLYQWMVNGAGVGSNNEIYIYAPGNNDKITCILTSNAICAPDPVISNVITMTIASPSAGGTIIGNSTITYGNSTDLMVLNGFDGTVTKWQKMQSPGSWTDIACTSDTYSETPVAAGIWKYRAQIRSGNCSAVYSAPISIIVSPKTLTIGGIFSAAGKEYDGTVVAAISSDGLILSVIVGSDAVGLVPVAVFGDKLVGVNKTVSLTGTSLTGADAGNYVLSLTGAPTAIADITPIPVTLGVFPDIHKTYGDPDFVLVSPASISSGAFSYTSSNTGIATISGNRVTIVGAGIATITVLQKASGGFAAATSSAQLTVAKANQVLTLNPLPILLPLNQFIGTPLKIEATSSSGLEVALSLGAGSPAILSFTGGSYYLTTTLSIGNVVIIAENGGNANYNPAQIIHSFDVTKGNQIITFNALVPITFAPGLSIDLTASANSGLPVSFVVISGPGSLSGGNHLTITGAGTIVIRASQEGNSSWNPATDVNRDLLINKTIPVITGFKDIVKTYGDPSFPLVALSNSSGAFSYTSSNLNIATVSGNIVTIAGAGVTTITVTQDESSDFASVTMQVSLTVLKADQIITFGPLSDKNLGDPGFDLDATSTSLLGISYSVNNTSVAAITGKTVTILGMGTVTITASQAGDSNYKAAPDVSRTLRVTSCVNPTGGGTISGDQELCEIFDPAKINSISAPTGQTGTLEYKWQESTVSKSAGFEDSESANSETYDPGKITQTTWFKRIARVVCMSDWTGAAESNVVKMTANPRTTGGKITGASSVIYGNTTPVMMLSGNVGTVLKWQKIKVTGVIPDVWTDINVTSSTYSETPVSAGTWKYRAQVQSGNCPPQFSASLSTNVLPKTLTIGGSFTSGNKEYDGTVAAIITSDKLTLVTKVGNDIVNLIAKAAFTDKAVGIAKTVILTGSSLTGADAGNYILSLADAPNAKADIIPIPVTLGLFPDIHKIFGDPEFVLVSPASISNGAFSYTSSNPAIATISGKTVTIIGAGSATITAIQEAYEGYAGASVTAILTVAKAKQFLTLSPLPSPLALNQFIGTPVLIEASSSSGLDVTITLGPDSPATLSFTNGHYYITTTLAVGIVEIIVNQSGNDNYDAAQIKQRFDVTKGNQTITFNNITPLTYEQGLAIDLTASASSGLPVSYAVMNGNATITNGNHLVITGAGTLILQASQAGDSSWNPASNVNRYLIVNKATPVITGFTDIIKTYGDPSFQLAAISNSPGAFTYTSSNTNVAIISGNRVTIAGAGITTITVTQDPGLDFTSTTAQITLFVIKADQTITFEPLEGKNLGDPAFDLKATSTSLLGVSFTSSNLQVATINGKTVTITGAGNTTITASQPGNSNYNPASNVYQSFRINSFVNPISSVQNLVQTAPDKLEFDVCLLDINSTGPFELGTSQLGFLINSLIYTGGKLSVTISNTRSELNTEQQFTAIPTIVSSLPGYPDQTLIRLAGRTAPGSGNGSVISSSTPGTLLTHFILTSTVSFTANSTPNLCYVSNNVNNPLYPTRVSKYIRNRDTPLTVIPGINAIVNGNPFLNPTSTLSAPIIVAVIQPTCLVVTGSVSLNNLPSGNWNITISPGGNIRNGRGISAVIDGLNVGLTSVIYTVKVTDSYGATSPASANIVINPLSGKPLSPVITKQDNALISSSATGNQWYIDGVIIPGATEKQYIAASLGTYYAIVTRNGCSSDLSNWIPVVAADFSFTIYPNPSSGLFNLKIETDKTEIFNIKIHNVIGKLLWQMNDITVSRFFKVQVDLSGSSNGVYIVTLNNKVTNIVKKVIVVH